MAGQTANHGVNPSARAVRQVGRMSRDYGLAGRVASNPEPGFGILDTMTGRALSFVVAFAMFGGPIASDVCGAMCAGHATHPDRQGAASHHHHFQSAQTSERIGSAAPCGHSDLIITESRKSVRSSVFQATAVTSWEGPILGHGSITYHPDSRGPRAPSPSIIQLRL